MDVGCSAGSCRRSAKLAAVAAGFVDIISFDSVDGFLVAGACLDIMVVPGGLRVENNAA